MHWGLHIVFLVKHFCEGPVSSWACGTATEAVCFRSRVRLLLPATSFKGVSWVCYCWGREEVAWEEHAQQLLFAFVDHLTQVVIWQKKTQHCFQMFSGIKICVCVCLSVIERGRAQESISNWRLKREPLFTEVEFLSRDAWLCVCVCAMLIVRTRLQPL